MAIRAPDGAKNNLANLLGVQKSRDIVGSSQGVGVGQKNPRLKEIGPRGVPIFHKLLGLEHI